MINKLKSIYLAGMNPVGRIFLHIVPAVIYGLIPIKLFPSTIEYMFVDIFS